MKNFLDKIVEEFEQFPQVCAISRCGSSRAKTNDALSDIDLEIFTDGEIPINKRLEIVKKYSSKYEVGGDYFGGCDEFWVDEINNEFDISYFDKKWILDNVENVWHKHYASNGYTTCFLFTLKNCEILFERNNMLSDLKNDLSGDYPQELKQNIIKRNLMLIKDKPFSSYYDQIKNAIARNDLNSVNHRVSALMASYFDIIFAKNELLHPGEKKLVKYALDNCKILPKDFAKTVENLYTSKTDDILHNLDILTDNLRKIL